MIKNFLRRRRSRNRLLGIMNNWICECGHAADMHVHHRRGTDCGTCGRYVCARYRPGQSRHAS